MSKPQQIHALVICVWLCSSSNLPQLPPGFLLAVQGWMFPEELSSLLHCVGTRLRKKRWRWKKHTLRIFIFYWAITAHSGIAYWRRWQLFSCQPFNVIQHSNMLERPVICFFNPQRCLPTQAMGGSNASSLEPKTERYSIGSMEEVTGLRQHAGWCTVSLQYVSLCFQQSSPTASWGRVQPSFSAMCPSSFSLACCFLPSSLRILSFSHWYDWRQGTEIIMWCCETLVVLAFKFERAF